MNEELLTLDRNMAEKEYHKALLENHRRAKELNINDKDNESTQLKIKQNQTRMKLNDINSTYQEPKDINCLVITLFICFNSDSYKKVFLL